RQAEEMAMLTKRRVASARRQPWPSKRQRPLRARRRPPSKWRRHPRARQTPCKSIA
ncbi:hypothetical protein BGZ47_002052, partial [Haplosporangium gracile]